MREHVDGLTDRSLADDEAVFYDDGADDSDSGLEELVGA